MFFIRILIAAFSGSFASALFNYMINVPLRYGGFYEEVLNWLSTLLAIVPVLNIDTWVIGTIMNEVYIKCA